MLGVVSSMTLAITGSTGHVGRLVAAQLGDLAAKGCITGAKHMLSAQDSCQSALVAAASSSNHRGPKGLSHLSSSQAHATGGCVHQHPVARAAGCRMAEGNIDGNEDCWCGGSLLKAERGGHGAYCQAWGVHMGSQAPSCQAKDSISCSTQEMNN